MAGSIKGCGDSVQEFIVLKKLAGGSLNADKSAFWASPGALRFSVSAQKVSHPS